MQIAQREDNRRAARFKVISYLHCLTNDRHLARDKILHAQTTGELMNLWRAIRAGARPALLSSTTANTEPATRLLARLKYVSDVTATEAINILASIGL
jgi:hypothetical protein